MKQAQLGTTVFTAAQISQMVARVATEIQQDYADQLSEVIFVGVMKGAYLWMGDLLRAIGGDVQMDYLRVGSYLNDGSTGEVTLLDDLRLDVTGKTVILLDEVIDSGLTLLWLKELLQARGAEAVKIAVAFDKRQTQQVAFPVDYIGASAPNDFLVGYGMDYNDHFRNLSYIATLDLVEV